MAEIEPEEERRVLEADELTEPEPEAEPPLEHEVELEEELEWGL